MSDRAGSRAHERVLNEGDPTVPVTLAQVAAAAGVSQPTASRVLNGSERTPAPELVAEVRRAADELGYIPNAQAQALVRSTSGLLGLVVHDIADPYFSAIAAGVQRAAEEHRRQVMLASRDGTPSVNSPPSGPITRAITAAGYRGDVEVEIFNADVWAAPGDDVVATLARRHAELIAPFLSAR